MDRREGNSKGAVMSIGARLLASRKRSPAGQ